jgi:hypothetical protein
MSEKNINIINLMKFGEYEHVKRFQQGYMFCKPLGYFKNLEREDGSYRHDEFEGTSKILNPKNIKMNFLDSKLREIESDVQRRIIKPITLSHGISNHIPIFCMYVTMAHQVESYKHGTIPILIDEKVKNFGGYVVIIENVKEFFERLRRAILKFNGDIKKGLKIHYSPVEYVDIESFHGDYGIFRKPNQYRFQSEFRIAFEGLPLEVDHSMVLQIPDLSDISELISYNDFKEQYKLTEAGYEYSPFRPYKMQIPKKKN